MSAVEREDCPDCQGQGTLFTPNFGCHAVDPFIEKPCGACEATGLVDADRVVVCTVCGQTDWVGDYCHNRECIDELRQDAADEAHREMVTVGRWSA